MTVKAFCPVTHGPHLETVASHLSVTIIYPVHQIFPVVTFVYRLNPATSLDFTSIRSTTAYLGTPLQSGLQKWSRSHLCLHFAFHSRAGRAVPEALAFWISRGTQTLEIGLSLASNVQFRASCFYNWRQQSRESFSVVVRCFAYGTF